MIGTRTAVRRCVAAAGAALLLGAGTARAHEEEPGAATGHQAQVMHLAGDHPVTFGAGVTMVAQGVDGPDDARPGTTYSVDVAMETEVADRGIAFIYINSAQGTSVDIGSAAGVNGDDEAGARTDGGYSDTRIAEAWVQFPFNDIASLTVGKIDPTGLYDGNEVANDETTQFLNDNFVNNMAIAFPGYVAGASLGIEATETLAFNLGAFEAADDFDGAFDSAFLIGQAGLATHLLERDGHVRLVGWSTPANANDNQGFAVSLDQVVTDAVTLFARYGMQDDTQDFDNALSLGGQMAVGDGMVGLALATLTATAAGNDDETTAEAYYRHALTDNFALTADVQFVQAPGFDPNADDAFVYGLRAQADL